MNIRPHLKYLFLLWGLLFCNFLYALSLGTLSVTSAKEENLQASIKILMSAKEASSYGKLQAKLADDSVYEKFGIQKPGEEFSPQISIQNDANGIPSSVVLKFTKKDSEINNAFNDIALDLIWSSGHLTRVYTILNTQAKEIQVQGGDNLVTIATQLVPQYSGVQFNQVLVALYRLNPKSFYAGNINRLKQGENLLLPTAKMAASIPEQEAREFVSSSARDFQERVQNRSSETVLKSNNRTYQQAKLNQDFQDRLKIGSSQVESEQNVAQVKLNEDLIAQQKMLEEAQQRISELERNIADLKQINANKVAADRQYQNGQIGLILGVLALTGIFLYGVLRLSKPYKVNTIKPKSFVEDDQYSSKEIQEPLSPNRVKNFDEEIDDALVNLSSVAMNASKQEIPNNVKEMFSKIDLNLPSISDQVDEVKNEPEINLNTSSAPKSGYSLDLEVGNSTSNASKVVLNSDEQKVRLNLARSYIKIMDLETARILLTDLVELKESADPEIQAQATQLLMEIS